MDNKIIRKIKYLRTNCFMKIQSTLWKREETTILFGAWFGHKFADNSRFLFQFVARNKEKLGFKHVVWVTREKDLCQELNEKGYEAYMIESKESINMHKTAKYHVVCNRPYNADDYEGDILGEYSYGAVRINLWHGVAGKGVGFGSNEYKRLKQSHKLLYGAEEALIRNSKLYRELVQYPGGWGNAYYLSTTKLETKVLKNNFLLPEPYYIESGYPRNCDCIELLDKERKIIATLEQYDYVILYLPTFRTGEDYYSFSGLAEKMQMLLEKNNAIWVQKAHSADTINETSEILMNNVLSLSPDFDINVLWKHVTVLITDYSSCMIDAVFHDLPILYYVPDYYEYLSGDRGFAVNPDSVMCGPKAFNEQSLAMELQNALLNPDSAKKDNYQKVYEMFWNGSKSLEEIWNDVFTYLKQ